MKHSLSSLTAMATLLRRRSDAPWRAGSHTGEFLWDTQPLTQEQINERNEELTWASKKGRRWTVLNGHLRYDKDRRGPKTPLPLLLQEERSELLNWITRFQRMGWGAAFDRIDKSGDPVATTGAYSGPGAFANATALAAVTGGVANVAWWTPLSYSPLPAANGIKVPAAYRLTAAGLITSSSSAQTITMNPAIGTAVAGQALGASSALALGSTITNAFWRLAYDLNIRTTGTSGTGVGSGLMHWGTAAGATATVSNALMGGGNTTATADFVTTQQALLIAATPSAAGVSVTPTMTQWVSWD